LNIRYFGCEEQGCKRNKQIKDHGKKSCQNRCLCSLAEVADRESYTMPEVTDDDKIEIKDGRHPVVEKIIGQEAFVPNDTYLDMDENQLL